MKEYICSDGNPVIENYCYGAITKDYRDPYTRCIVPPFIELYAARAINGELCLQDVTMDYPDCYEQFSPVPVRKIDLSKLFAIDLTSFKKKLKRGSMKYKDRDGMPILAGMCVCDQTCGLPVVERKGILYLNFANSDYVPLSKINLKKLRVYSIPLKLYTEGNKNE